MARLDPSIRHAISPPEFDEGKLHREHLVDRLHGEIPRKLVAIAAPAGYGKTTLLADFAAHTEIPIVWIHVTEADQDLMRFSSLLLAGLERRFRRLRDKFDLRGYSEGTPAGLARAISTLIDENIPESFAILLDDAHVLHSSEQVMSFLDAFLDVLPEQGTVIAAGREVLDVSLARLMAEGNLAGLGPHDLAFSRSETNALLSTSNGREVTEQELVELLEWTQGWITGIVLSEQSGTRIALGEGLPEQLAYEYLASVVLNRQPDSLRRFMIDASVLPVMTSNLCDKVLDRSGSRELLRTIAAKGLFVTVSATEPRTYEFHPLFRGLLLETLKAQNAGRLDRLRVRAAHEVESEDPDSAIELLLGAGRGEDAAAIAEGAAEEYLWRGRFSTLEKWLEKLDLAGIHVPILAYCLSVVEGNRGDHQGALDRLAQLESNDIGLELHTKARLLRCDQMIRAGQQDGIEEIIEDLASSIEELNDPLLKGRLSRVEALHLGRALGDYEAAVEQSISAVAEFTEAGNKELLTASLQDQTMYLMAAGRLDEARKVTLETVDLTNHVRSPISRQAAINNLAHIEYVEGDIEGALSHYSEARSIARRSGFLEREAIIIYGQAEAFSDIGLPHQAATLYQEMLEIATSLGNNSLLAQACIGTSILHRRNGGYQLAREWLRRADEFEHSAVQVQLDIQNAILLGLSGPRRGIHRLETIFRSQEDILEPRELCHCLLFSGLFHWELGNLEQAEKAMRDCFAVSSLKGAIQYVSAELAHSPSSLEWIRNMLGDFPVYSQIEQRVKILRAFGAHYGGSISPEDQSSMLEIRALGGAELRLKGESIDDLKPQVLELLIYLTDKGSAGRDELADLFWSGHPPGRQAANLHMTIYSIRRALGKDSVVLDGTVYRMGDDLEFRYDVEHFEHASSVVKSLPPGDPRRLFALTEATSLYTGEFLPEYFGDWVEARRRELELSYLDLAAEHAEEALLRDQPRKALKSLRFALSVDPYRDDLNERYLRILDRLGRRSEAVSHFRQYSSLIRDEFGLEPSPSVQEVHDRIVGGR